jgi:HD-GYP domain-containing protein (c-di-GMP phosphodiesterase class II)
MPGDRLLEIIHAQFPQIVKILLTGYTGLDSALYCINNANLDKYISKPWLVQDLHMTVTSLLRQFRLRQDNETLLEDLQLRNLQLKSALRELRKAHGQIETTYIQTLQSLAAALDAKDPYTAGPSERVARWAAMLARRFRLSREETEDIRAVCMLHDIGKIGLPEKILNKTGRLTTEEMDMVRMHPIIGSQILEPLKSFARYVPIVRHHHEWYNGNGYPDRLGGNDLPLAVWVTALADAFDAMTSNRPYRKGQNLEFAFGQMIGGMDKQFNPECVKLFVELLQEPGFNFEEAIRLGAGRKRSKDLPEPLEAAIQHLVESGGVVRSCCAMVDQYGALGERAGGDPPVQAGKGNPEEKAAGGESSGEEPAEGRAAEDSEADTGEDSEEKKPESTSGPGTRGL